ncbi:MULTISPECIES: Rrf2 family transcriptional regulator [Bacillus]|uniref:Rrf2 family transcriptional regulator n=1 Tax=Bacillus glycinifermentans TaxID=1664069 RepID=A0AAJ4D4V2_9BACI|nr:MULTISPECIES: Rrf2 family transcriptional regulator [Bacillus]KKB74282.1 transcriptional regulator [Bacillus sp. TH008]MDU0071889.1 Rrf2 family transcriptional regulator [Bacillus sp. IG6]MED8019514.1 Rrf2 family transcriptional regulator [Bacillus glycinifermentans]QAT67346.1 Rrf2 family transcriptional regulator [Bacillus glycinifermentans]WKB76990.1 Rrf2 family transcriptional regulator [Bacillus glycinifermentans]
MVNSRLAVAIHILSLIASNPREQVSSEIIAGSVNTNPVVIRRMISLLKKADILTSRPGVAGASLKRAPVDISLLDIYRAVQSQEELFAIHEKPNPDCPVGKRIQSTLDETFYSVQRAMENELASKSLKDILFHLL